MRKRIDSVTQVIEFPLSSGSCFSRMLPSKRPIEGTDSESEEEGDLALRTSKPASKRRKPSSVFEQWAATWPWLKKEVRKDAKLSCSARSAGNTVTSGVVE